MADNWESEYLKKIYGEKQEAPEGEPVQVPIKNDPPKKKKKVPFGLVISVIFLMIFSAFLGFSLAIFSKFMLFEALLTLMPGEKLLGATNILVLGVDQAGAANRSDTIMAIHIDPANNTIGVVSIPRDTKVTIPGRGEDKINHAYAYGGAELSKAAAENFLGIKIPYYVVIDISGLRKLIDEVGGVEIDVEKRMYYVDYSQNLFVDLKPGRQRLNGTNALSYLRYRADGGDLTRILRQQKFIQAFAAQITNKENIVRSPQLVLRLFSNMDTNLRTSQVFGLALNIKRIYDMGSIKMTSLDGSDSMVNGVYYMQPDYEKVKNAVNIYLKGSSEANS